MATREDFMAVTPVSVDGKESIAHNKANPADAFSRYRSLRLG